ncbi:MAG: aldehyde dehydrogenase [Solirubrobacteraceae bacterium]|jgi:acyl-CoA reductase-like NAD-dependent aldehyde dehydrogenase
MATTDLREQQLLINGEWRAAGSGDTFSRLNPYTGETATTASAAGRADAHAAVDAAHEAFSQWSQSGPGGRRAILSRAAELIGERQEEIAQTMIEETGATFGWGMFNCMLAGGILREAAAQTYGTLGAVIPSDVPGKLAMAVRAPAGVVVGIAPWNAPVILAARAIAMPLAYGNTVVLKASELCPRTHAHVAAAIADAGAPAGVINFLTNQPEDAADVVEELIAHPNTRRVNFTGSTRVGRIIAQLAGRHLKRTLLELGGKAPLIVLADADLERAAAATSFGAFFHQGQICMSTERVIVERAVAEPFAALLAARASALRVGDPRDAETQIGPLVNDAARAHVSELVEDAREHGAQVLAGGVADGPCYPPTVLFDVNSKMRVYGEESFGPLASIIPVDGVEAAIEVANDTEYGLSAAIFSANVPQALELAQRVQSGICHINDTTVHDEPQMPFGGVKDSGWGRFGGQAALEEFTELRWITIQESERHYPI